MFVSARWPGPDGVGLPRWPEPNPRFGSFFTDGGFIAAFRLTDDTTLQDGSRRAAVHELEAFSPAGQSGNIVFLFLCLNIVLEGDVFLCCCQLSLRRHLCGLQSTSKPAAIS